ncbi:hypothetical protein SCMU_00100 [Sinomonas cyclohexanicum]|uniref:Uncharacterized protein n=1 Tax=Sinomonas cyclohexanicum TaxID=322009 RepID=A0ABN6FEA6_SINCY|nr:hypothetical protein [Corynebacterium cyclohexanicum]BCT74168.1 hypothetical protein SCMU_00100 [Corynebacterium cyclohexanicum]
MARSVHEITAALAQHFPEGPPADATVQNQGFDYLPSHWTSRWPDSLPVPEVLLGGDRRHVSRRDVFAVSAAAIGSDEDLVNLYVAICAWGTGTKAQRVARAVKPLHEKGAVDALARSLDAARSLHPVEAYRRLNTTGEDRIKHFGAAFFTKWLYFSSYNTRSDQQGPAPLILDSRVAKALGWGTHGWNSKDYGRYLELATDIQDAWCPRDLSRRSAPSHVVEYALFKLGGS